MSSFVHYFKAISWNWSYSPETLNSGQNQRFLLPCVNLKYDMTLKNNKAPLLRYFKLCVSFRSHWSIQTGVTVQKCPIWVKISDFLSRVTLKFDGWHWKTIRHFFKLELQPEKPNSGQNLQFLSCVNLKFDRWPWKTIGQLFYATSSFVYHFIAIGKFKLELRHLFYATASFVHHFIAMCEFKLELQSGNIQIGQNFFLLLTSDLDLLLKISWWYNDRN